MEVHIGSLPTGAWATMPVTVLRGIVGGPTIWLSGGIHGDEVMGVEIVRQLIRHIDPQTLRGTIIAVPIVNILGFTAGSRYLPDGRDLNRSFPGSARGSQAARLAHTFYQYIVSVCKFGMDFHSGSRGRSNLPQVRGNLDDPQILELAGVFGTPIAIHSGIRDGSLRGAAQRDGIGVLLFEGGEAARFDLPAVRAGYRGALRVMKALKMLKAAPPRPKGEQILSRKSSWTRAGRSGFCHLKVSLGELVERGQSVATISDSTSTAELNVRARTTGVVIGVLLDAIVHRGDALVHIAEIQP